MGFGQVRGVKRTIWAGWKWLDGPVGFEQVRGVKRIIWGADIARGRGGYDGAAAISISPRPLAKATLIVRPTCTAVSEVEEPCLIDSCR